MSVIVDLVPRLHHVILLLPVTDRQPQRACSHISLGMADLEEETLPHTVRRFFLSIPINRDRFLHCSPSQSVFANYKALDLLSNQRLGNMS